jgi:hypothetical protein
MEASRSDGQIFQHTIDPLDNEADLLQRAVTLAGTSHVLEGTEIKLRLHETLPCFEGEDMGLASGVLLLKRGEERGGNLHPEEIVHT